MQLFQSAWIRRCVSYGLYPRRARWSHLTVGSCLPVVWQQLLARSLLQCAASGWFRDCHHCRQRGECAWACHASCVSVFQRVPLTPDPMGDAGSAPLDDHCSLRNDETHKEGNLVPWYPLPVWRRECSPSTSLVPAAGASGWCAWFQIVTQAADRCSFSSVFLVLAFGVCWCCCLP